MFSEALSATFYSHNYEQVNATDLTPDEVAAQCYDIYLAWLDSTCAGGECPAPELPDGSKIYRRNPTTRRWEFVNDEGEWEEPSGVDAIPAPAARAEATEAEKKCLAARNAVDAIYQLWLTMLDQWENDIQPDLAWAALAVETGLLLGGQYYKPLAAAGALVGVAFDAAFALFDVLTDNTWNTKFLSELTCIFERHATLLPDNTVTFDQSAIVTDVNFLFWSAQADVIKTLQAAFLIGAVGEQALNSAGGLTAITSYTCGCGSWARKWEHAAMHNGAEWARIQGTVDANGDITPTGTWPGTWAAITCTVDIPANTTINTIEMRWVDPAGGTLTQAFIKDGSPTWVHSGTPDDAPYLTAWTAPINNIDWHADLYTAWVIEKTGTGTTQLTVALRGGTNEALLKGFIFRGDGPCPFITGTII